MLGKRADRIWREAIQAFGGGDPNAAFAILKQVGDRIAREPVSRGKGIDVPLVCMHYASA